MARPGISTKNTERIPPGPKFWTPRIYPQNTPKIPKKYPQNTKNAHFWYFFGILGVFSWGSRISARGVFFRYFSWKFRVWPSRGSVAGRGILKSVTVIFKHFEKSVFLNWEKIPLRMVLCLSCFWRERYQSTFPSTLAFGDLALLKRLALSLVLSQTHHCQHQEGEAFARFEKGLGKD